MNTYRLIVHRALRALLVAPTVVVLSALAVCAQVSADYVGRQGFTDPRHTRSDGYQESAVTAISDAGYTVGTSKRFASGSHADQSAWMGSPYGGSRAIGLYSGAHKDASGRHFSRVVKLSRSGRAIGLSARYDGGVPQTGRTAWIASWVGGTRPIGLYFDSPAPVPDARFNDVFDINEAGQSIGIATVPWGQHAWVADAHGVTRAIGLVDEAYMSPGQAPFNTPVALNASGTVVGHTEWSGGQVAWLQSNNPGLPARRIGLYGGKYIAEGGRVDNGVRAVNEHGYAVGYARYGEEMEGTTYFYDDAWVSTPAGETTRIADGVARIITNSGLVAGESRFEYAPGNPWIYDINTGALRYLFDGGDRLGIYFVSEDGVVVGGGAFGVTWLAPAGQSGVFIGFFDLAYDGGGAGNSNIDSSIVAIAPSGLTVGATELKRASGKTAWMASPITAQTQRIGLYGGIYDGAIHEEDRGDGVMRTFTSHTSEPTHVTRSRFAAGYSLRLHGDDVAEGQTAWIYNADADRYATLEFSVRPSDGYAFSQVHALLENGIAVGTYTKFAEDGTDLGDRAFVWVTRRGAYDLGSVLNVDPEAVGWDYLASGIVVNEAGVIAGHGVPYDSTSQGVFLAKLDR